MLDHAHASPTPIVWAASPAQTKAAHFARHDTSRAVQTPHPDRSCRKMAPALGCEYTITEMGHAPPTAGTSVGWGAMSATTAICPWTAPEGRHHRLPPRSGLQRSMNRREETNHKETRRLPDESCWQPPPVAESASERSDSALTVYHRFSESSRTGTSHNRASKCRRGPSTGGRHLIQAVHGGLPRRVSDRGFLRRQRLPARWQSGPGLR
jgi:hypothetical protein